MLDENQPLAHRHVGLASILTLGALASVIKALALLASIQHKAVYCGIGELADSLCRDDPDMSRSQYKQNPFFSQPLYF